MRTKILLSVIIVLVIGVAAAGYQINSNTPGLWQPITPQTSQETPITDDTGTSTTSSGSSSSSGTSSSSSSSGQSQTGTGGSSVQISAIDAQSIAQKVIEEPGASAGNPTLETIQGEKVYIVPVMVNQKKVGYIEIDPKTGEVIGGAGGISTTN
jgi:uncharacterized membrane protein YkoI